MRKLVTHKATSYKKISPHQQQHEHQHQQSQQPSNMDRSTSVSTQIINANKNERNYDDHSPLCSRRNIKNCLEITLIIVLVIMALLGLNFILSARLMEIKQRDNVGKEVELEEKNKQLKQEKQKGEKKSHEHNKSDKQQKFIQNNQNAQGIYEQGQLYKNLNQPLIPRTNINKDITIISHSNDLSKIQLINAQSSNAQIIKNRQAQNHQKDRSNDIKHQSTQNRKNNPQLQALPIQFDPKTAPRSGISQQKLQQWKKFINLKNQPSISNLSRIEHDYFADVYQTQKDQQLPFCIVIPTYNNIPEQRYISNLNSIFQQNYKNYRIMLIDDASTDGTGQALQKYIIDHSISKQKLQIVLNQQRKGAMANIYHAAHNFCQPEQIMMIIDGDDELIGKQVFKLFNTIFHNNDVWIVYTNSITTNGELGYSRPYRQQVINKKLFRKVPFTISHLRAFYTKLFRLIKQQDFKDGNGQWFKSANDVAMFLPMLQLSQNRIKYVPEISYLYNVETGNNNHRLKLSQQKDNQKYIRSQKRIYQTLDGLFDSVEKNRMTAMIGRQIQIKIKREDGGDDQIKEDMEVYGWET